MSCAFDSVAFDDFTFDVCVIAEVEAQHGSHRRNRTQQWYKDFENQVAQDIERHEMKLSEELAKRLQEQIAFNQAMMQVNNNLLLANNNLLGVVSEIQSKAQVVPEKPAMDPEKKAILMERLAAARQAKDAKKAEAEAKHKQMLKNLAKARKARGK